MPNSYFAFKQFTIHHDRCAMKVGTDGVLLGAWTDISSSRHILDIGTGTGLISLMLAQRCNASIVAIDIDQSAVEQAMENVSASPWSKQVEVQQQDIGSYHPLCVFDTIVSNPPYFPNSLKCLDVQRNTARHTDTLPASVLMEKVSELLATEGKFSLILPFEQSADVICLAERVGMWPSRHTAVITSHGLPPKRSLLEFGKVKGGCLESELTIELERHVYTEDYIALTKEFYLKM